MSARPTRRAMLAAPAAIVAASVLSLPASAGGTLPPHIARLWAELDRSDAWVRSNTGNPHATDDDWDNWCNAQNATLNRIVALPNTPENMRLRARAVGCAVENTADLANLDLSELAQHARHTAGVLVRQVLACLVTQEGR